MGRAGKHAIRVTADGPAEAAAFRDAIVGRARELGVMGWVRSSDAGAVQIHAEGDEEAVDDLVGFLRAGPSGAALSGVAAEQVEAEGHEQFAVRGVSAGRFVVREHAGTAPRFDFRLEVGGVIRSWAVPKGPSLDPAAKRMAIELADRDPDGDDLEGAGGEGTTVWDRGTYEQGGRVAWPEALERGHAVFVLHGEKLQGGFALQRTGGGKKPRWLLIKRRDDDARPGSDVVAGDVPRL
ncbi:MAG TPA: DNA polymerase ligase N-terminal domain-containing protein [Solirubrobacterales bacterium]|jgi:DNA ligase D-like protein (predicted 3'-phosphoesterase)|nr:DNA polymerase ligase N-terminal domain-containing protein [Solirubrobacterales bacterium]